MHPTEKKLLQEQKFKISAYKEPDQILEYINDINNKKMKRTIFETKSNKHMILHSVSRDIDKTHKCQYVTKTENGFTPYGGIYNWSKEFFNEVVTGEFMDNYFE